MCPAGAWGRGRPAAGRAGVRGLPVCASACPRCGCGPVDVVRVGVAAFRVPGGPPPALGAGRGLVRGGAAKLDKGAGGMSGRREAEGRGGPR